jgi:glycosyltransferase involved in cell wall biosynthesis
MVARPYHLGTDLDTRGGISAVLQVYVRAGFFDRWRVHHAISHTDRGGRLTKVWYALRAASQVWMGLLKKDISLLHIHTASGPSFWRKILVAAPALLLTRVPIVLHVHGGGFAGFYASCGPVRRHMIRKVLERADRVLALTPYWAERLRVIAPAARIDVLVNPVELPQVADAGGPTIVRDVVLFLGLLQPSKGAYDLLEAFARIASNHPQLRLVLAGIGDIESLNRLAAERGIADQVILPGWINTPQRSHWLQRAVCLALPSYAEGLPMAILEAMAMGVPVVASAVGGIPQVVRPGHTGWLLEPGDIDALRRHLMQAITEPKTARTLGQQARKLIESEYAAPAIVARLESIYASLGLYPPPAPAGHAAQAKGSLIR